MSHHPCSFHAVRTSAFTRKANLIFALAAVILTGTFLSQAASSPASPRERISIDDDWRFAKGDPTNSQVHLIYDVRPQTGGRRGNTSPDQNASAAATNQSATPPPTILKQWILPTGNDFLKDASKKFIRPEGDPDAAVPCAQGDFDDSAWQRVNLPHDWAITGPFITTGGGGMGRLPSYGVGWYRKQLQIPADDAGKSIFLEIDGAMSYATVWLNGRLVGGWPYGYASWRLDLTPYVKPGGNELAIRLDNPPDSSRWYPGAGIYRNVWLVKTAPVHVGQWGTYLTTPEVSASSATVDLKVIVDNNSKQEASVRVSTQIFPLDADGHRTGVAVAAIAPMDLRISAGSNALAAGAGSIAHPKLWGPPPMQRPNRYVAVTTVTQGEKTVDIYETPFGIRALKFDPNGGFFINGEHVPLNGVYPIITTWAPWGRP